MSRVEQIGNATLYLGDCRDVLPTLGKVDAVVTDPPYGINYQSKLTSLGARKFDKIEGDDGSLDLRFLFGISECALIFGANNFPEILPHRGRWLCWDKRTIDGACDAMLGSPFELAWASKKSGYGKIVRCLHGGVVNADGGKREHPTQKPIKVMVASIQWAAKDCGILLDPFMGSGTTGVACIHEGKRFIGIEREPAYFDIACRRIAEAYAQPRLFEPSPPAKPVQPLMFEAAV